MTYLCVLPFVPVVLTATIAHRQNRTNSLAGIEVPLDIGCPFLAPRTSPAKSVHDLRPDDFRIVAGIGDSVMAGFGAKGIQRSFFNFANLYENRGVSFAIGGDPNAITMPNILNYYAHHLNGSSVGEHLISICFGNQLCPQGQYRPNIDRLNAAQSGARSLNLDHEIDYLLGELKDLYETGDAKPTDWKLLTVFIGSNDICHSCTEFTSLPPAFGINVMAAIDRIKKSMTHVLVQIIGIMKVQDIVVATSNYTDYCRPIQGSSFVGHDHMCECSHSVANRTLMASLFPQYNSVLQGVSQHFQTSGEDDNFTVVFQPLLIDILSFPIQAISNIDCFHPSVLAHEWMSKMLWKMMFMSPVQKQETLVYDARAPIFCPTENDRIQTR
ncbi:hypothetical protein BD560DRAFT_330800 [Blakeslea trispora]|nr:hypothetical protein BD560DRAFT_330800 [Blakeslea trispora]